MLKNINLCLILFVIMLASCSSDVKEIARLSVENDELKSKIAFFEKQKVEHIAKLEYQRKQATYAYACELGISVCPESFVAEGRQYLKENGLAKADEPNAYLIIFVKSLVITAIFAIILISFLKAWIKWITPDFENADYAKQKVAEAKEIENNLQKLVDDKKNELAVIEQKIAEYQEKARYEKEKMQQIKEQIEQERKDRLLALEKELEALKLEKENEILKETVKFKLKR